MGDERVVADVQMICSPRGAETGAARVTVLQAALGALDLDVVVVHRRARREGPEHADAQRMLAGAQDPIVFDRGRLCRQGGRRDAEGVRRTTAEVDFVVRDPNAVGQPLLARRLDQVVVRNPPTYCR